MERDLKNKIVVVTGASKGIGFSIASEFLREGAKNVIILDIDSAAGAEAANVLNIEHGDNRADFFNCDVTTDVDITFDLIISKYKTIDVLVNNAGILAETSIKKTLAVNTVATVEWTMKFWNHARKDREGKGGTVINIASVYGYMVDPFSPCYKASKYAVIGFTRTMGHKIHYEQTGIRVMAVCPGFTKTTLSKGVQRNPDLQYLYSRLDSFISKLKWQDVDAVSKATVEVFKTAESGTVWTVKGAEPIEELRVPPEHLSFQCLINEEL